jgi:hypothetical protein
LANPEVTNFRLEFEDRTISCPSEMPRKLGYAPHFRDGPRLARTGWIYRAAGFSRRARSDFPNIEFDFLGFQFRARFYKTQLRPTLKRIDAYVIRWARRKFKRMRH